MKKSLMKVIVYGLVIFGLFACGNKQTAQVETIQQTVTQQPTQQVAQQSTQQVVQQPTQQVAQQSIQQVAQYAGQPVQQQYAQQVVPQQMTGGVTIDQAKQIAVSNVGLQVTDVTFIKTMQDYDDGMLKWEIEFVAGNNKYEYDISASNGAILKSEVKPVALQGGGYIPPNNGVQGGGYVPNYAGAQGGYVPPNNGMQNGAMGQMQGIGVDAAKSIAVGAAGFALNNVTFTKTKMDYDDGMQKWEIEFVVNNQKYEYEISASNGAIVKSKVESVFDD